MSSRGSRLLWIVLGLVALVAVAAVAFGIGFHAGHDGGPIFYRRGPGMMGWGGDGGWYGVIPLLLLVFVGIFLVVLFLTGDRRYRPGETSSGMPGSDPLPPAHDVDRLRELSELHERGRLTDEEFAAAKRKLLGL